MDRALTPGTCAADHDQPVLTPWKLPMDLVLELWRFMYARKKYWLLPVILMTALLGGLMILSQGTAVAPFIYTIF